MEEEALEEDQCIDPKDPIKLKNIHVNILKL